MREEMQIHLVVRYVHSDGITGGGRGGRQDEIADWVQRRITSRHHAAQHAIADKARVRRLVAAPCEMNTRPTTCRLSCAAPRGKKDDV